MLNKTVVDHCCGIHMKSKTVTLMPIIDQFPPSCIKLKTKIKKERIATAGPSQNYAYLI